MLHAFSGSPGTGKSLNAIKFIIENNDFETMPVYYHGIRCLLLDFDVCNSFVGWLYGIYYPANTHNTALVGKLLKIDKQNRLAALEDFPYLAGEYQKHEPVLQWLTWFKKVASKNRLALFNEALAVRQIDEEQLTEQDIKSLGLSWTSFENPYDVHTLPSGSVILVDEVQNIWPPRPASKKATPDIEMVTTHRHNGQELVYISQDFRDVDQMIRRRMANYTHFEFMGGEWLYKYQHNNLFDPSSKSDLKMVGRDKYKRDSSYYGLYLSSVKHTQKVGLSGGMKKQLKVGLFALIILLVGIYFVLSSPLFASVWGGEPEEVKQQESYVAPNGETVPLKKPRTKDEITQDYVKDHLPRLDALPFSAPIYDSLTSQATNYPKLTCVQINESCECFTQQFSTYEMSFDYCLIIAANGFFDSFHLAEGQRPKRKTTTKNQSNISKDAQRIFK